jgi:predicted O-methyltransferase YrrM
MAVASDAAIDDRALDSAVRDAFAAEDRDVDAILAAAQNEWIISQPLGRLLTSLVLSLKRRSILEFGAGTSSLVLARALQRGGCGGRLTSVEHQPEHSKDAWQQVSALGVDACLAVSRLRLRLTTPGLLYMYTDAGPALADRAPYDLVLVDAPPGQLGRDAPLYQAYPHLAEGAIIVLDDARRPQERTAVRRWLAAFPGLRLVALDADYGRGTAVLVHTGDKRRRLSARNLLGSLHDRWLARGR